MNSYFKKMTYYMKDHEKNRKLFKLLFIPVLGIFIVVVVLYLLRINLYEFYLDNNEVIMETGSTYQIKLIPKNNKYYNIENYEYRSENPNVAIVSEGGTITSINKGVTNVIVKFKNSLHEKKIKVISNDIEVNSLQMNVENSLQVDDNSKIITNINGRENIGAKITYESDNESVLKVDEYGNLDAIKEGRAKITAKSSNGVSASIDVMVNSSIKQKLNDLFSGFEQNDDDIVLNEDIENISEVLVDEIKLNITNTTLNVGDSIKLRADIIPLNATNLAINWSSSNENIAKVDNDGTIMAIKPGTTTIKATTANGKTAICDIVVKEKEIINLVASKLLSTESVEPMSVSTVQNYLPEWSKKVGKRKKYMKSDSLKVDVRHSKIQKKYNVYLTYVWVKDANNQLHKRYGNSKPANILKNAVKKNNLKNKIVVGFNASPPVNNRWYKSWNKNKLYSHKEPSHLMIRNGTTIINNPNKKPAEDFRLYYIDRNNNLQFSPILRKMSVADRKAYYQAVIDSGTRNTMTWRPALVANHAVYTKWTGHPEEKQALCQLDTNNFIVISAAKGVSYQNFAKYLADNLGCATAVELDGGGSTTSLYKPAGTNKITKIFGGGRSLTMVMYFTEL